MVLKRADKEQLVTELTQTLREAPAAVVASFRALPMHESMALRREIRGAGGHLQVVPKRLFRRIAEELKWSLQFDTADSILVAWTEGPAKLQQSGGTDLLAPAKTLHGYVKAHGEAAFLGGVLEGDILDGAAVSRLATLPSLEALRGQFVSVLLGPLRGFLGIGHSVLRGLPAVLQAQAQKGNA